MSGAIKTLRDQEWVSSGTQDSTFIVYSDDSENEHLSQQ